MSAATDNNWNYYDCILSNEVGQNVWAQATLPRFEEWLEFLSEKCGPTSIMDYWVPIVGAFDIRLMLQLTSTLGVANMISSVEKWLYPEDRPYWWVRENDGPYLRQHRLTCETTSGFPSGHSVAFTAFTYIVAMFFIPKLQWLLNSRTGVREFLLGIVTVLCMGMWLARIYFSCHFLHQCVVGSIIAVLATNYLEKRKTLYSMERDMAIGIVVCIAVFVATTYFAVSLAGFDPHWSVRLAFNHCDDPEYLKHESSPIFSLCRDFGYAMGIAFATPLAERLQKKLNPMLSVPAAIAFVALNFLVKSQTPKNHGRLAFVAYEFVRNFIHSYTLVHFIPKFFSY